ncbi:hypothetical protein EI77_03863 [Prosthecobacter fusiformis]|uniref:Uncharacterized protein n=1 Tax=Prosthecobacter fusiformis TaxID=48464 RepID=A0A4R7RNF9_9BACT|nr:hypothetical protein [Prosthecobacter fusiformis]TDU66126.1 hypothetical protein EI77_03863 [Prosthecobacter fusiformis]
MPQLTINLPDDLMTFVNRKTSEGYESPENYVLSLLEINQWQEEHAEESFADPQRQALEDILEERDKGPFIPVSENLTEIVMEKVRQRLLVQGRHA